MDDKKIDDKKIEEADQTEEWKVPENLTGRHAEVYKEKLSQMHHGPCSSPRRAEDTCPCTDVCPIHGRCCDCLVHHTAEQKEKELDDLTWLPYCLKLIYSKGEDPFAPGALPDLARKS